MARRSPRRAAGLDRAAARAVALNFAGDVDLYRGFAAVCSTQFGADARQGQAACDAGELPALRAIAHKLRFALELLARPDLAVMADTVERAADAGARDASIAAWRELQPALLRLGRRLAMTAEPPAPSS